MSTYFRRSLALPQDHGSWVFLFSPLTIGLVAGGNFTSGSLALTCAALIAFLIRQPVTVAAKALTGRRPRSDLPGAAFWLVLYGSLGLACALWLAWLGQSVLFWLAAPALPVFGWHLWLVSQRNERRQAGIEILGTGILALAAPAAYWIGQGEYAPLGWVLWILTWFQSAASIVQAYLRLEQREWTAPRSRRAQFRAGSRALAYTGLNLVLAVGLGFLGIIPGLVWLPYLLQLAETLWGTLNPAAGAKPVAIGVRQLIVSTLFTLLFILTWR